MRCFFALFLPPLCLAITSCGVEIDHEGAETPASFNREALPPSIEDNTIPFQIDPRRIQADVAWLASDGLGGRRPGTLGNDAAVDYVEEVFRSLGLEPAGTSDTYRQPFQYIPRGSTQPIISLTLNGERLSSGRDIAALDYSGSGEVRGEIVFVGYGITIPPFDREEFPDCPFDPQEGYDDYRDVDVNGRIALAMRMGPDSDERVHDTCPSSEICLGFECLWQFGYKAANARLHGASALLMMNNYRQSGARPRGGSIQQPYFQSGFPALMVHLGVMNEASPDLRSRAASIDSERRPASVTTNIVAELRVNGAEDDLIATENVLGVIPGADPLLANETIIVGAHLDHLGTKNSGDIMNGADDNASGTAVMLELARAMVGHKVRPARTVLFAAWNAEEDGLIGSCFYVTQPSIPLEQALAAFSVDMVGGGNGTGLVLDGGAEPMAAWLAELMENSSIEQELPYWVDVKRLQDLSDHRCFFSHDVPAVLATTPGPRPHYHTAHDAPEYIRASDLEATTRLLWETLVQLALGYS